MPAEWEPHEATWISWPKNFETFGEMLPQVEQVFVRMAEALCRHEKIRILVDDEAFRDRAEKTLNENGISRHIEFFIQKTVDVWIRDYGPIFVKQGRKNIITKWEFNAWGNKYQDLKQDNRVFDILAPKLGFDVLHPGIVLKGGSIDVNGKGSLITTEQCLLNKNRNPSLGRDAIENHLERYLGASSIIWLEGGVAGDDTDGHVDDIARFVNERTLLCAVEEEKGDENYAALKNNFNILSSARGQDGEPFDIVGLPMPVPVKAPWGRLPASYANFYIGNRVVLLPVFNDRHDATAISVLSESMPKHRIVPIDCTPLVWGLGAIHCSTQQQPL